MLDLDAVLPLQPLVQRQPLGRVRVARRELPELVIAGAGRRHLPGELPGQLSVRDGAVRQVLPPPRTEASQLRAVAPPPVRAGSVISTPRTAVAPPPVVGTSAPLPRPRTVGRSPGISRSAGADRTSSSPLRTGPARAVQRTSVSPGAPRADWLSFPAWAAHWRRGSPSIRSSGSSAVRRPPSVCWRSPAPAWRAGPLRGPPLVEGRAGRARPPGWPGLIMRRSTGVRGDNTFTEGFSGRSSLSSV